MRRALRVEWLKLRRSTVAAVTGVLLAVALPAMALGFYALGRADGAGATARKASAFVVGEGWEGYLGAVDQIGAVAVLLGAGVVATWVFGREHADHTFPSLFSLAVSRTSIAAAKFVVLGVWCAVLSLAVVVASFLVGIAGSVGPLEAGEITPALGRLLAVTSLSSLLALPAGLVASVGRGYLPAIGALIVVVAITQVAVLFGTGGWMPFAVPGLLAVAGADGAPEVHAVQIALVPATVAALVWFTLRWWQRAEAV